jgi:hypothetical protein
MIGQLAPTHRDRSMQALFRSYQCGLCHHVGATYGPMYRLLAGVDMVFLDVFLDLWTEAPAIEHRACVVAPVVTRLPARVVTNNARFAAAFGVYMAVEKLRDDYQDEGGLLRWLAWRSLASGHRRAREELVAQGFPVETIEAEMAAQAAVETGPGVSLDSASAPTRAISAALFAHAPGHTDGLRLLGDRVGAFLFYMDNLLDLGKDLREGGYNAIAAAFGLRKDAQIPDAAWSAGIAGARAAIDDLEGLVRTLPETPGRAYVARTLVHGFRGKLACFEAMSVEERLRATLRDVLPQRPTLAQRVGTAGFGLAATLRAAWGRVSWRAQAGVALLVAWAWPTAALAQEWWPDTAGDPGLDTGIPDPTMFDTAGAAAGSSNDCGNICDPCVGNCGWVSCSTTPCDDACGDACSGVSCS